jgi:hypothetical protein
MQCVENCNDPDLAKRVYYEQPVWQTLHMFVGELGCEFIIFQIKMSLSNAPLGFLPVLFAYIRSRHRQHPPALPDNVEETSSLAKPQPQRLPLSGWKFMLFWLPALCDLTATTVSTLHCELQPRSDLLVSS